MHLQKQLLAAIIIGCMSCYLIGMATGYAVNNNLQSTFYDGEGNTIPPHAIDSLIHWQFVKMSPAGIDTLDKYFHASCPCTFNQ